MTDEARKQWVFNYLKITKHLLKKMADDINCVYQSIYDKNTITEGEYIGICSKSYRIIGEGIDMLKLITEQVYEKIKEDELVELDESGESNG